MDAYPQAVASAVRVLTDPGRADAVDSVMWIDRAKPSPGSSSSTPNIVTQVHVASSLGHAVLSDEFPIGQVISGDYPLGPDPATTHPDAFARLVRYFTDARSADIAISIGPRPTSSHHHRGEHGALTAEQSCAPLLISGPTVNADCPRGSARVVDIAPTLLWALGVPPENLGLISGYALTDVIDPTAGSVLISLWDGVHDATLRKLVAAGELPGLRRLVDRNHVWLANGLVAEYPSVTMVNHASAVTGVGPDRHGIVGNVVYNPATDSVIDSASPGLFHWAGQMYRARIRTFWEALPPQIMSVCINEMNDRGAEFSTFDSVRDALAAPPAGSMLEWQPEQVNLQIAEAFALVADRLPATTHRTISAAHSANQGYSLGSRFDVWGFEQALKIYAEGDVPRVGWWSQYVTDIANHAAGPGSDQSCAAARDCDQRLAELLAVLASRGSFDDMTVMLIADHGTAVSTPDPANDWADELTDSLEAIGWSWKSPGDGMLWLAQSQPDPRAKKSSIG